MRVNKTILGLALSALLVSACGNDKSTSQNETTGNEQLETSVINNSNTGSNDSKVQAMPKIKFDYTTHDFGRIYPGQTVSHSFTFTNVGDADLILGKPTTSCGCTVPKSPTAPIKPGEKSEIIVEFTKTDLGNHKKSVVIPANTSPNSTTLYITAEVVKQD